MFDVIVEFLTGKDKHRVRCYVEAGSLSTAAKLAEAEVSKKVGKIGEAVNGRYADGAIVLMRKDASPVWLGTDELKDSPGQTRAAGTD